jgi:hypothetical protein
MYPYSGTNRGKIGTPLIPGVRGALVPLEGAVLLTVRGALVPLEGAVLLTVRGVLLTETEVEFDVTVMF